MLLTKVVVIGGGVDSVVGCSVEDFSRDGGDVDHFSWRSLLSECPGRG